MFESFLIGINDESSSGTEIKVVDNTANNTQESNIDNGFKLICSSFFSDNVILDWYFKGAASNNKEIKINSTTSGNLQN